MGFTWHHDNRARPDWADPRRRPAARGRPGQAQGEDDRPARGRGVARSHRRRDVPGERQRRVHAARRTAGRARARSGHARARTNVTAPHGAEMAGVRANPYRVEDPTKDVVASSASAADAGSRGRPGGASPPRSCTFGTESLPHLPAVRPGRSWWSTRQGQVGIRLGDDPQLAHGGCAGRDDGHLSEPPDLPDSETIPALIRIPPRWGSYRMTHSVDTTLGAVGDGQADGTRPGATARRRTGPCGRWAARATWSPDVRDGQLTGGISWPTMRRDDVVDDHHLDLDPGGAERQLAGGVLAADAGQLERRVEHQLGELARRSCATSRRPWPR